MVRGRRFNRMKNWTEFPLRRARNAIYNCKLCSAVIMHGQDYHDAGNNVRVCIACAEFTTQEWRLRNRG